MSRSQQTIFTVFLSSPGDVAAERARAIDALGAVQRKQRFLGRVALSVVAWDDPAEPTPPVVNQTPQLTVNDYKRPPSRCDLTIAILWSRLGSPLPRAHFKKPDGSAYASGTEWEIADALRANKTVLAYTSLKDLPRRRSQTEIAQTSALDAFIETLQHSPDGSFRASLAEFKTIDDFARRLESDVERWIDRQLELAAAARAEAERARHEPAGAGQPRRVPLSTLPDLGKFVGRASDLQAIDAALADPSAGTRLVLAGEPGVGKSHLACAWGIRNASRYPGGTHFIPFNADPVQHLARLVPAVPGEKTADQAARALTSIAQPTLLVYDNIDDETALTAWLPPPNLPVHVLVTTTQRYWSGTHSVHQVPRLDAKDGRALVAALAGEEATERYGRQLVARADGIAVELKAAARFAAYELHHGREPELASVLSGDSRDSFERAFSTLPADAQLAARAASLFNPAVVPEAALASLLDWKPRRVRDAIDQVIDRGLAARTGPALRIHGLMCRFLRERSKPELSPELLARHFRALVGAAIAFARSPASEELRSAFASYPQDVTFWVERGVACGGNDLDWVGTALYEMGKFAEAQPWFERAVSEAEQGDDHGRVDHQSLGRSVHEVGRCLSNQGKFAEAQPWYERAVDEKQQGDVHGRVDHQSLGISLHLLGHCLSAQRKFAEAHGCYQRAVAEAEQGDVFGRVNQRTVALHLRSLAGCLRSLGKEKEAEQHAARAEALESDAPPAEK